MMEETIYMILHVELAKITNKIMKMVHLKMLLFGCRCIYRSFCSKYM